MRTTFSLLFISLFLTFAAFAGEWTDDFDDPEESAKNWTPTAGEWTFAVGPLGEDLYTGKTGAGLGATITDIDFEDGITIDVRGQFVPGGWGNFGLIFAYVSEDEAYQVDMRNGNGTFRVEKFTPNVAGVQVLTQGNQISAYSEWFDVKVVA